MSKNSPLAARRIIDDEYAMSLDVDELCRVTEEAEREARVVEQPTDPPDRPPFVIERTHVYHAPAGVLQPEPQSLAAYEDEEIEATEIMFSFFMRACFHLFARRLETVEYYGR